MSTLNTVFLAGIVGSYLVFVWILTALDERRLEQRK